MQTSRIAVIRGRGDSTRLASAESDATNNFGVRLSPFAYLAQEFRRSEPPSRTG